MLRVSFPLVIEGVSPFILYTFMFLVYCGPHILTQCTTYDLVCLLIRDIMFVVCLFAQPFLKYFRRSRGSLSPVIKDIDVAF